MPEAKIGIEKLRLLGILQRAREAGLAAIRADETTFSNDDQDCYPRGLQLRIDRDSLTWLALCQIAKELGWVNLDARRQYMHVKSPEKMKFRLTERGYLRAVCQSLLEDGIECYDDVNWH